MAISEGESVPGAVLQTELAAELAFALQVRRQVNLDGLRVETYQLVLCGECQNLGHDFIGLFRLYGHDHVVACDIETAGPGARSGFVFRNHFDFRLHAGQAAIERIHLGVELGLGRLLAAKREVPRRRFVIGNRYLAVPHPKIKVRYQALVLKFYGRRCCGQSHEFGGALPARGSLPGAEKLPVRRQRIPRVSKWRSGAEVERGMGAHQPWQDFRHNRAVQRRRERIQYGPSYKG